MGHPAKSSGNALKTSIATAALIGIAKFIAGLVTNSMAIMASALDSFMDVGSSTVNLIAFKEASKPPDKEHAYGHGKIESLAGLFQSIVISISGVFLVYESIKRLLSGSQLEVVHIGIAVMAVSMAASIFIVWRINRAAAGTSSLILSAERLHYSVDILSNAGVIIALLLVQWSNIILFDLLVSLAIAIYIFKASFGIMKKSVDELLDSSLPASTVEDIKKIIFNHDQSIVGIHNFRSRKVGAKIFLDFHVEIRGEENFKQAHTLTESLILAIKNEYPGADITAHYDPEGEE